MDHLELVISMVSEFVGVDRWIVAGVAFMLATFIGKSSMSWMWKRMRGENLPISSLASEILKALDQAGWESVEGTASGVRLGRLRIFGKTFDVQIGNLNIGLNRREKKLICAKARMVREGIDSRLDAKLRDEVCEEIRKIRSQA